MAITINHPFVSAKGDGSDATLVRPSNWNESHNIKMATNSVIGRLTAGVGLAEELPVTSYMMGLLNLADFATLAAVLGLPTTGDAKLTFKITADVGWVLANDGSIGDLLSNGTARADPDTAALFTFFYNTFSDVIAPVQSSTGAATTRAAQGTAATAFGAHCRVVLPRQLGRALIVAGTGAGLSARALGGFGGEEAHTMTLSEMVAHTHTQQGTFSGSGTGSGSMSGSGSGSISGSTYDGATPDHLHQLANAGLTTGFMDRANPHHHDLPHQVGGWNGANPGYTGSAGIGANNTVSGTNDTDINHVHGLPADTGGSDRSLAHNHNLSGSCSVSVSGTCTVTTVSVSTTISGNTASTGSGTPFNVMQPWAAWNIMIKL